MNTFKKFLFSFLAFAALQSRAQTNIAATYAAEITTASLNKQLSIIASAEMEGRETASPGQKKAAAYIESEFKRMGLKPGNGDS